MKRPMYHAFEINKANEELAAENLRLSRDVETLTAQLREVEAERLEYKTRAERAEIAQVEHAKVCAERVAQFRQRAIEAVRAHVNKYDDHYMHCLTKCIPELLQSLPATSEQEEQKSSGG